jgi:hypothetical protein
MRQLGCGQDFVLNFICQLFDLGAGLAHGEIHSRKDARLQQNRECGQRNKRYEQVIHFFAVDGQRLNVVVVAVPFGRRNLFAISSASGIHR